MEGIFTVKKAASAMNGEVLNCGDCGDSVIKSVSTDTRTIDGEALFFALHGENSDGHRFIKAAAEAGAVCCVADDLSEVPQGTAVIKVENTNRALLDLAGAYRREMKIPVVAVTGSVGKTSTRGMIASVLSQKYKTLATEGNFNNEIGVPHTLFRMNKNHEIAVIEMGMNHFGELSRITAAVRPETAVITNVGEAHIENLGNREGILKAKLEILEGLPHDGTVILCGDNDMLWSVSGKLDFETIYFGMNNSKCDLIAQNIKAYADGSEFTFKYEESEYKVNISIPGVHHIYNALAAIIVGVKYNVPIKDIITGIREFTPDGMRQKAVKMGEYTVIMDCYNANPTSMRSGLEVLSLSNGGRKVACLGDMMELGTISAEAHRGVGEAVNEYGIDVLITVGERAKLIAEGAKKAGMSDGAVYSFDTIEQLSEKLYDILKPNDVMLLKASRSMRLERIAEFMENNK